MHDFLQNPLVKATVAGFAGAFLSDIHAWASSDAGATFIWQVAIKRWVAGAVSGLSVAAGLGAL